MLQGAPNVAFRRREARARRAFGCPQAPAALRETLRATRADGFATEDSEVTLGFRSVGVAVRDHAGWPVAAIAVTWQGEPGDAAAFAAAVAPAAAELARRIG